MDVWYKVVHDACKVGLSRAMNVPSHYRHSDGGKY
jgi:hypothetical protein